MPTGYLRRHLVLAFGIFIFAVGLGLTAGANPVLAAGPGGTCESNSDCTDGDCSTAGSCACTPGATESAPSVCTAVVSDEGEAPSAGTSSEICRIDFLDNPMGAAQCVAFQIIAFFLQIIVIFLGWMLTMALNVLMAFATYNDFANAPVVRTGWVIVRDIVNMFFIVILLVSAFATIIGAWEDFNYRRVLPKLLLMAILINFSRTLIQLMIDFSQVVMLTFVNAFQSASQGNFVNALRINEAVQLASGGSPTGTDLVNVIISWMLAIFMLSISLAVIIILMMYIIVRIIGLWIALIFSPIAFFATALPDRLKRGLDTFTGKYWSRLVSLLTGGPVIAFFLWLTLATVQESASAGSLAPALNFPAAEGGNPFLTEIGNSNQIASFVVAITMLMTGLEAAVSSAQAVSSTLGKVAEQVGGAGGAFGRLAAFAPFLAAGYGARYAARGAIAGTAGAYRAADRRLDITGGLSRSALSGLAAAQQRGGVIGAAAGLAGRAARPALQRGLVMRRKEAEAEAAKEAAEFKEIGKYATDREVALAGRAYGTSTSPLKTLASRRTSMKVNEIMATDDLRDRETKRRRGEIQAQLMAEATAKKQTLDPEEAKARAEVMAREETGKTQRDLYQNQIALARSQGDDDTREKLEKIIKANPHLAKDADKDKVAKELATSPDIYKDVSELDSMDGQNLTQMLLAHGWQADPKTGAVSLVEPAADDRLEKSIKASGNRKLLEGYQAHKQFAVNSPGVTVNELKSLRHRKNAADGTIQAFSSAPGAARVRNKNQDTAFKALQSAGSTRAKDASLPADQIRNFIGNNGNFKELMQVGGDSKDGQPAWDVGEEVMKDVQKVQKSLKSGNTEAASRDIQFTSQVLSQIGPQGSAEQQTKVLSGLVQGLTDSTGKIDTQIFRDIGRFEENTQKQLKQALETVRERTDDILRAGGSKSGEEQSLLELRTQILADIKAHPKEYGMGVRQVFRGSGSGGGTGVGAAASPPKTP